MKQKPMKSAALAFFVCLAMVGSVSAAATVSYSYYTATGLTDTSWVNVTGYSSIVAGNAGGASTSYGGVNWGAMLPGNVQTSANGVEINISAPGIAWAATSSGFYAADPYQEFLNNGAYSGSLQAGGVDHTINLSGLTVGMQYLVQFVMADNRDNPGHTTILAKGGDVSGDSNRYRYSYTDGQYAVITASFTADAATARFQAGQRWADDVPDSTFITGVQVLAVPEPSAALIGGLGMLCMLRRRRL